MISIRPLIYGHTQGSCTTCGEESRFAITFERGRQAREERLCFECMGELRDAVATALRPLKRTT